MSPASRTGGRKTFVDQKDEALALALSVATATEAKTVAKTSKFQRPTSTTEPGPLESKERKYANDKKSRSRAKLEAAKAQLLDKRKDKARARKDGRRQRYNIPTAGKSGPKDADKPLVKRVSFA